MLPGGVIPAIDHPNVVAGARREAAAQEAAWKDALARLDELHRLVSCCALVAEDVDPDPNSRGSRVAEALGSLPAVLDGVREGLQSLHGELERIAAGERP